METESIGLLQSIFESARTPDGVTDHAVVINTLLGLAFNGNQEAQTLVANASALDEACIYMQNSFLVDQYVTSSDPKIRDSQYIEVMSFIYPQTEIGGIYMKAGVSTYGDFLAIREISAFLGDKNYSKEFISKNLTKLILLQESILKAMEQRNSLALADIYNELS